jgi:hypothetical protein
LRDLQRPEPGRERKKSILIATEDEKSSRLYFASIGRMLRARCVIVIADHAGSDPRNVVKKAKEENALRDTDHDKGLEDRFDEVWVVFDTEGQQNENRRRSALDAIETARQLKFKTAVSNPSFEYWLLLHFEWTVDTFPDGDAVCHRLRKHIPDYGKNTDSFLQTWELVPTAITHARRVFRERCPGDRAHPCQCHPCTEVYKLVESLKSA